MALFRRRRRYLIPGPVLIGFGEMFDRSYGDPKTPLPYVRVTPTKIGGVLLPFPCPHCDEVRSVVVDSKRKDHYRDSERGFSWCPACRKRYVINPEGQSLVGELPAGATHAPALVERCGERRMVGLPKADGLNLLGVA